MSLDIKLLEEYEHLENTVTDLEDYLNTVISVFKRVHGDKYIIKDNKIFKLDECDQDDIKFFTAREDFKLIENIQNQYLAEKVRLEQLKILLDR